MLRIVFYLLGMFLLIGCKPSGTKPPQLLVANFDTLLRQTNKGWLYKRQPFNGYMVEKDRDGKILYKLPIIDGLEQGLALGWFNTGEKLMVRHFKDGMKQGLFEQWWPNGNHHYLFNYEKDVLNGQQLVFYPNGKVRQESNYLMGNLEGIQRYWDNNGVLVSNYTIKNNKLYGVIKVKSCMPHGH
jgi:antitoxin component YwqK of YwqJK toxin-antitoxin module